MFDIIIPGGGFSGVTSALECAKKGYNVLLLEANPKLLGQSSSSRNQCYRLHTGLHYPDKKTSLLCLEDTVCFVKNLPKKCLKNGTYKEYSRYYLMSNSLYSEKEMKENIQSLKDKYSALIKKDPSNKVLGEVKDFIKEVNKKEYQHYVATNIPFQNNKKKKEKINVVKVMDIIEPAIDFEELAKHYRREIYKNENIMVIRNQKVTHIERSKNKSCYVINTVDSKGKKNIYRSLGIINCTWQNIEKLNSKLGFINQDNNKMLNRMKVSVLVKLPKEAKNIPTSLFCTGPYCAMSNLSNGTAILTYEPITNIGNHIVLEKPTGLMQEIQEKGAKLGTKIGNNLANKIIEGCTHYIPCLKESKPLGVRIGYVKTLMKINEKYSINKRNSPIHRRRQSGIEIMSGINSRVNECYINNAGMKFTYILDNAKIVANKMNVLLTRKKQLLDKAKRNMKVINVLIGTYIVYVSGDNSEMALIMSNMLNNSKFKIGIDTKIEKKEISSFLKYAFEFFKDPTSSKKINKKKHTINPNNKYLKNVQNFI